MRKKLFTLLLATMASVSALFAESGTCGANLTWDLTNGVLTISGTGEMDNYDNYEFYYYSPWYSSRSSITSLIIGNSVTSIGESAFEGCSGLTSVTIPNSVTSIGDRAFYNCSSLTSVTIPNSVTSIGSWAFYDCSGLTSVTIGNSVTSIEDYAFCECSSLSSVTIPNSVTSIGNSAFNGCAGLTSVTIPNSVTSIGNIAFANVNNIVYSGSATGAPWGAKCINGYVDGYLVYRDNSQTELLGCSSAATGDIEIPNSVTSIGDYAFGGCSSLTSVTIPNSVTSIGYYAFSGCSGLTSVTIPNSVTSIGRSAFSHCTGLTSVTIPNSVTSIEWYAFKGCTGLTSVTIPNSVTSIERYAFEGCTGLTSVTIPNSVTSIGSSAFSHCIGVKSLILSSNWVKYENSDNLYICGEVTDDGRRRNDTSYVWMNRLEYIEAPAWFFDVSEENWAYCPKQLENVVVNNGELSSNGFAVISRSYKTLKSLDLSAAFNTELADEAIKNFYNITELKLPRNTERIGYMSVAECVKLQSIDIPASVIEIEDRAFENCRSLKTITFGGQASSAPGRFNALASSNSQLQRIGNWAFYNCHELQNLEIPEGVTEIGDGAFYGCTYLENLTLPASIQSIGDNTFALCAKMKKIVVNAVTPPSIQAKTFFDVKRQIPVYVPDESISAYLDDPQWSEFNIQGISHMPEALEQTPSDQPSSMTQKLLHNGQILILRGDRTYTVTGQEIK